MFNVVSVSLGSPSRDHETLLTVAGERFRVRRVGTGGDIRRAALLLKEMDGRVAAIGLGGINRDLVLGRRRYPLREGRFLYAIPRRAPVADGERWKTIVEPAAVGKLVTMGLSLKGRCALVTSVLDRAPLARALEYAGSRVLAGDAFYALGLPLLFSSPRRFDLAARIGLPFLSRLPITRIYPLGKEQERSVPGPARVYVGVDLLAGDFHFLRRRLPRTLDGRVVIASTLTPGDLELLRDRGVGRVAGLVPLTGDRCFGANVWEAMAAAAFGIPAARLTDRQLLTFWREAGGAWIEKAG